MPGKNFRRLNEQSCLDCTHNKRMPQPDRYSVCDIDNEPIRDDSPDRTRMPHEFVCDDFEQVDWEAKKRSHNDKGGDLRFVAKNVAACALVRRQGGPVTNHLLSRHSNPPKQK